MKISLVIPAFNEEKNLPLLYQRLKPVLRKVGRDHEIIFINDGSIDNTLGVIKKLRGRDKKIRLISFSRNFGHMPAIDAGLIHAKGDWVVLMDADLQDPPEIIPQMVAKAKEGFEVVYGVKQKRKESLLRRFLFTIFYRLLNMVSIYKMPLDAGTFSLMSQRVVKILTNLPERNKYLSGLRAWTGFTQVGVVYERGKRSSGQQASIRRLIKLALDGVISFSYLPLRLASFLGFICALVAFISIIGVFILRIFFGFGIAGWASTMSTILLVGGIQLITLGILGEYLARIYDEVKNRPKYIIEEKIGFSKN
ncbi:glycosyltransferase family 2 protein [Candidatus Microgenomates bacterium]|nr:glycosyltransferase family 2 protein [Candidatus Microgenomates bacterium]